MSRGGGRGVCGRAGELFQAQHPGSPATLATLQRALHPYADVDPRRRSARRHRRRPRRRQAQEARQMVAVESSRRGLLESTLRLRHGRRRCSRRRLLKSEPLIRALGRYVLVEVRCNRGGKPARRAHLGDHSKRLVRLRLRHCALPGAAEESGVGERCTTSLNRARVRVDTWDFQGDYYSLPNLVPLLARKSRLELMLEILDTPLPQLD